IRKPRSTANVSGRSCCLIFLLLLYVGSVGVQFFSRPYTFPTACHGVLPARKAKRESSRTKRRVTVKRVFRLNRSAYSIGELRHRVGTAGSACRRASPRRQYQGQQARPRKDGTHRRPAEREQV